MHVTIERPLRRESSRFACVHGVSAIDAATLIEIAEFCDAQKTADPENRSTWDLFKDAAEGIVNHDLIDDEYVSSIGPFYLAQHRIPQAGDQVVVESGACIRSTHPKIPMEGTNSKRRQRITVHRVSAGYYDSWHGPRVVDIQVHWAGTGGYWKWTSFNNIIDS